MAKHEVGLEIVHTAWLGKVDIKIPVRSDGEYLGTLGISQGSVEWVSARRVKYARHTMSWEKFAAAMEATPSKPIRSTGRRAPRRRKSP